MKRDSRIYIAGHTGMIGSALLNLLKRKGYTNLLCPSSSELDLKVQEHVEVFFKKNRPEYVFFCAAKVGGIKANVTRPAEFIYDNTIIQSNVLHFSHVYGVKKLIFLASSCIYPKGSYQPMAESELFKGEPEKTNEYFAYSKINGIKMCQAHNKQYGTNFISIIPSNVYGPNDHFDLENSHVLSALITKFSEAVSAKSDSVMIWGTGKPLREFLFVNDLADALLFFMKSANSEEIVNVGSGEEKSIYELVLMIKSYTGYHGEISFDHSKPDGIDRKLLDSSRCHNMGWKSKTKLKDGVLETINWYLLNKNNNNFDKNGK